MQSTSSLAAKLRTDYPQFSFTPDETFRWSPSHTTIYYIESYDASSLLHELSHALLSHSGYTKDIELLQMERDAWHYAKTILAPKYDVVIHNDVAEDALDTYRDWLHARSICPKCAATGIQSRKNTYKCIGCGTTWRVNEARICHLRRYVTNKKHTS